MSDTTSPEDGPSLIEVRSYFVRSRNALATGQLAHPRNKLRVIGHHDFIARRQFPHPKS